MTRFIIFLSMFLSFSSFAHASDQVAGTVKAVRGSALAVQKAQVRPLQVGDDIFIGDILSTGADSHLNITMIDEGAFQLGAETSFVVIDYTFGQDSGSAVLNLLQGAMNGVSGQLAKLAPQGMEIQSSIATIGIRGTKFFVGDIDGEFNVAHWSGGGVSVKNDAGAVFLSGDNEGTVVSSKNTAPTPAKAWGQEKIAKARRLVQ